MDISVVIPSYNTQTTIGSTLKHLQEQNIDVEVEVILVDCSEHDEVSTVAKDFSNVRFHKESKRFNPGEGRNIGAKLAQGELIVFIDSDVRLAANSLQMAWNQFQEGKHIFGGALELDTEYCADTAAYLEHYFFNHESQALRPPCERSNLSSALMCFKRTVFLQEGGFKDIPRMQDTELTERLRSKGYKLYFCPNVLGFQIQDSPMKKVFKKIYINGQNLYFIRYASHLSKAKKLLLVFLLPLIGGAKTARIIARHLRYQNWKNKMKTLTLTPVLIAGGIVWTAGFYKSIFTGKGISNER